MNIGIFNAVGKWAEKVNRDKKPKVKFYNNGLLIVENNNKHSLEWYSFDLNRRLYDSLLEISSMSSDVMTGITRTTDWMPYQRRDYKIIGKVIIGSDEE